MMFKWTRDAARGLLAREIEAAGHPTIARSIEIGGLSLIAAACVDAITRAGDVARRSSDLRFLLTNTLASRGMSMIAENIDDHPLLAVTLSAMGKAAELTSNQLATASNINIPPSRTWESGDSMAGTKPTLTVRNSDGVVDLERHLADIAAAGPRDEFVLKANGAQQSAFLRDMWLAMVVAAAADAAPSFSLFAPGVAEWPNIEAQDFLDDETAALSLPYMLALQREARVLPEKAPDNALSASLVRRHVSQRRGGLLGQGGKFRRLVEFDPDEPIAAELGMNDNRGRSLEKLVLRLMAKFEVGAITRGATPVAAGVRQHVIDFLRELHLNAYIYARATRGVRTLGFRKHLYRHDVARNWAAKFPEILEFVESQGTGMLNLVETTISDHGPGIVGGFRRSAAAAAYADWSDTRLIETLLHDQLSGNLSDPNAGLGTVIALDAALKVGGFVTLRTGKHWYVMSSARDRQPTMRAVPGNHPVVRGTHWALIYPDALSA